MRRITAVLVFIFAFLIVGDACAQNTVNISVQPANSATLSTNNGSCGLGLITAGSNNLGCKATVAAGVTVKWEVFNAAGTEQNGACGIWQTDGSTSLSFGPLALTASNCSIILVTSGGGTTPPPPASTPTTPTACGSLASGVTSQVAFGGPSVNLTWSAGNASETVTVMRAPAGQDNAGVAVVTGAPIGGPCLDTTVVPGQSYDYWVQNADGPSNIITENVPAATPPVKNPPTGLTGTVVN